MKVPFKYYLHDDSTSYERAEYILNQTSLDMPKEEFSELIGRPFYEVTLNCELNTETGEVTVTGVEL